MIRCVKNGECLADIALCVTGAVEGVWALAVRNGVSVTAELRNGMELAWLPEYQRFMNLEHRPLEN